MERSSATASKTEIMKFDKEIYIAISASMKQKSAILAVIFGIIFFLQLGMIFFSDYFDFVLKNFDNKWVRIFGPAALFLAFASEILTYRYISRLIRNNQHLSRRIILLIVFIETSFPTAILLFVSEMLKGTENISMVQLLNSPPVIMYFLMIMLSSLVLDYRVSIFAGLIASVEFAWLVHHILDGEKVASLDVMNSYVKVAFIFLSSIIAAFVSYKTKEAVMSSLHAKDALINKLDHLVHEKTKEIREQKNELEQKNKDILDSLNYAKRIQLSQMPTETYLIRILKRIRQ
jgi:hypothetical protein